MGRFRVWRLGLLGVAACAVSKPVAVAPPAPLLVAPVEPVTAEPVKAGEPARAPCEVLRAVAEAARRSFPEEHPAPELAPCLAGKGGAYSFSITYVEDATDGYGPGYVAEMVLLHADAAGNVARSHALSGSSTGTYSRRYALHGLADYDADGTDELLLDVSEWEFEGNGNYYAGVWRVAGARVEPYPPAAKISIAKLEDVDQDGLPDLLVATPFQGTINGCGPDGDYLEFGPKWPMHARAGGGFAFDEVSRAELRRVCPKRPDRVVVRSAAGVDNTELRERLACAVAWGVKSDVIVRELERDCPKSQVVVDECAYQGVLPLCVNVPQLAKWAAVKAPFVM
jgi:hypothetical protein